MGFDDDEKQTVEIGNTYLVKVYSSIQEIYIEQITETAYKLRKEKSDGTWYLDWILKSDFETQYEILEYLNTLSTPPQLEIEKAKIEYKGHKTQFCVVCNGDGYIPDDKTSTGTKTCPKCWGSGYII